MAALAISTKRGSLQSYPTPIVNIFWLSSIYYAFNMIALVRWKSLPPEMRKIFVGMTWKSLRDNSSAVTMAVRMLQRPEFCCRDSISYTASSMVSSLQSQKGLPFSLLWTSLVPPKLMMQNLE